MTIHISGQYFLNHRLEEQEIRRQVRELAAAGYESIYGHARQGLKTPYFSEAWWNIIKVIVEECRANGVQFAIWDEDYFPSAVAGDRIIWNHPELAAQSLEFTVAEVSGTTKSVDLLLKNAALLKCYALPKTDDGFGSPIDLTAHCGTIRSRWEQRKVCESAYSQSCKVGTPHWRTTINHKTFALQWQPGDEREYTIVAIQVIRPEGRHNTDILNPETTRKFIEYTHQEYLNHFSDEILREHFHAAFMDEPAPAGIFPWTRGFNQEFINDYGFSLLEYLPHLILDIDEKTPLIRHKYRMTQMRLQCESYLAQIKSWCQSHGIKSVGHLTRTEYLSIVGHAWPNELRCCKYLDIPCTDPLGSGIAWRDACAYHTGLKVVSSAAHIFGKEQAGSDALAVMGNEVCLRDLKFALDFQMVMGINYFNIHGLNYSLDGPRKDETPPSLFYQHTEWKYMKTLIEHTKNTCEALTGGRHICGIAVLYPAASFYCAINQQTQGKQDPLEDKIHQLSETLLSHQKDFDFIDEITLAELTGSGIPEDWQVIILPYLKYIETETMQCLSRFIANGGKVIVLGQRPQLLGNSIHAPLTEWTENNILFSDTLAGEFLSDLPGPEVEGTGSNDIFVLQRENNGKIVSFLVNRAEREFNGLFEGQKLQIAPKGSALLWNRCSANRPALATGESVNLNEQWEVEFEPNQVPLCCWNAVDINGRIHNYNLMERQKDPLDAQRERKIYISRFLFTGNQIPLKLVLEESSIAGDWKVFVNKIEIQEFRREQVYDCMNITADIGHVLRWSSTPTENIITIETEGESNGLFEVPYLYGNFKCEHRHAHKSLPYLTAAEHMQMTEGLQSWNVLGYGTFSGTAHYVKKIDISRAGSYFLKLGRVEDVAEVF
ncbi:MAG: glycosyl hydrolase, partial [Victivallaceae bacterium]